MVFTPFRVQFSLGLWLICQLGYIVKMGKGENSVTTIQEVDSLEKNFTLRDAPIARVNADGV